MKRREIEDKLNKTVSTLVPDVLDNILAQCEVKEGVENMSFVKNEMGNKEEKRFFKLFVPKFAYAFATLVICVAGVVGFNQYIDKSVYSIIDIDVNPSIEIETNRKEKIIAANALNEDGRIILKDMNLEKVDLEVGINAIIGSMLKNGYITDVQNSILVSVKNDDEQKAKELEERVLKEVNEILTEKKINGSILSQRYTADDVIEEKAKEHKVSEGKANLINKVLKSEMKDSNGDLYTFESLAKLSINELNLLLNSKKVVLDEVSSKGSVNASLNIGKEKAKQIAVEKANVEEDSVYDFEVELDCDDGKLVYEVEFKVGKNEYDYEIDAQTGIVIKEEVEIDDDRYDRD